MKIRAFILSLVLAALTLPLWAEEASKIIALVDTPSAVQSTIKSHVADGVLGDIDKTTQGDETVYEVTFTPKGGEERDFTVAEDGSLVTVEMLMPELPAPVRKTIETQANGWTLENVDKNVDETEPSYDVDVSKDAAGKKQEKNFSVAENGDLLSVSVALKDTPSAVQATIQSRAGEGTVESVDKTFDTAGNQFNVEVKTGDGTQKAFTVTEDGRLYSEEVSLGQVPPAARRTITEKIGEGKLLRIEKALLEKKDGVLPYHVESRKAGKEFDFSVGPKGRFLGMDE